MLKPPQTHEVLPKAKVLMDNSSLAADLKTNGHVVITEGNALDVEEPDPADDDSWWRAVLMPVIPGLNMPDEHLDKVRGFRFRLRMDFNPPQLEAGQTYDDLNLNMEAFLEGAHLIAYQALHLQKISITKATQLYSIIRKKAPGNMFRDEDKGYRYMMAEYLTVLGPTN